MLDLGKTTIVNAVLNIIQKNRILNEFEEEKDEISFISRLFIKGSPVIIAAGRGKTKKEARRNACESFAKYLLNEKERK